MNVRNLTLNSQNLGYKGGFAAMGGLRKEEQKRYKHFEQLDDDTLMIKSVLQACRDVEQGSKMKLYKAMPAIATGILGTTAAITRPGKLSSKIASGAGFFVGVIALNKISKKADELVNKNQKNTDETAKNRFGKDATSAGLTLLGSALALFGACFAGKNIANAVNKSSSGFAKILKNDKAELAKEINSTKLGKFVEKTIMPFEKEHANTFCAAAFASSLITLLAYPLVQTKLHSDLSNDIQNKAIYNFTKGKLIQEQARADFDKINAIEV